MSEGTENTWQNGITVKRTSAGYMWTIAVAADGQDHRDDLHLALEQARELDDTLTTAYGPLEPKANYRKPRSAPAA